jgi:Glycosyl-4,4'-diaponeurosporenoate acyltransferase
MRFQFRLSTLLVVVGAIVIWLAAWLYWMAERGPGAYLAGAAAGALAAIVFAALRPSAGYYRLRPFEASGEFYARLGVRFFRRFVPGGDYFNRLLRRTVPDFRAVRSLADVAKAERFGRFNERVHVSALVFLLPPTCWGLVCGQYGFAAELILFNGLFNLYPAMLQRYTRARLEALAWRRDRLQSILSSLPLSPS